MHEAPESIMKKSGFVVSERCSSRPSCFDFAARKNNSLIFVKSQPEISSLSQQNPLELRSISDSFLAASLLICDRAREKPLKDDTVYTRYGVVAVTFRTFENMLVQGLSPLVQASPGGYYVRIDSHALRKRRQELDLSVADVADLVGISRRTIYGYERGMVKASVPVAYNIARALGIPVVKQVNIFDRRGEQRRSCILDTARRMFSGSRLLQKMVNRFVKSHITIVKRAPFDFILIVPGSRRIIGGIANVKEPELSRRVEEIISVSGVVDACPVLITEGERPAREDILCVSSEEVSRMNKPEDLIAKVT